MEATLPENEPVRLEALAAYQILDTLPEQSYDDITRLASLICGAPMALITFIDEERQWFKARIGVDITETPRAVSFCAHAILQPEEMLVVPDAQQDPRFADNPFVRDEPHVRFYAGAPLVTTTGQALGALCVVDQVPRQLTPEQTESLQALARQVMIQLDLRQSQQELQEKVVQLEQATEQRREAEQRRRESEALFHKLLESFPSGSVNVFDRDLRYLLATGKGLEEVGLSSSKLIGKTLNEMYTPEQVEYVAPFYRRVLSGEDVEFDLPLGDQCYTIYATPLRDDDGAIYALVAIAHNTTTRKEAEERLRTSEERFRRIFEEGPLGIAIISNDKSVSHVNARLCQMLGYSEREFQDLSPADVTHPDDVVVNAALNDQIFAGEISSYHVEKRYLTKQGQVLWGSLTGSLIRSREGEPLYALAIIEDISARKQYESVLRNDKQELERRVESRTAELHSRARQQEAVADIGRRALSGVDMDTLLQGATALVSATLNVELTSILELLPEGEALRYRAGTGWASDMSRHRIPAGPHSLCGYVLHSDAPLVVTDIHTETRFSPPQYVLEAGIVSSIAVAVGGYEKPYGTLAAHSQVPRVFTQDDVTFLLAMTNVLGAALERHKVEEEMRVLNAQLIETNRQLQIENLDRQMAMGAFREVVKMLEQAKKDAEISRELAQGALLDAEKARQEAESANQAKSEFLSRMSHELRTPLNAILGFGQVLEMRSVHADAKQQESVAYILEGGRHLLNLINEVLDIAKVESGGADLFIEPLSLEEVVFGACALVQPLADQRQVQLEPDLEILRDKRVLADRQRLKQVLMNLLSNAIKYNRLAGDVVVSCQDRPSHQIRIEVRDSGVGIAAEDIPKLFTPFERLSAANSEVEGTGLGLVVCQRLAVAMGGSMGVESAVGQGSTFFIELPMATASEEESVGCSEDRSNPPGEHTTQSHSLVLCIEDNLSNVKLLEAILESRPEITLVTAMQGSVGLDLAIQHHPDLILLDVNLPDLMGDVVLARLKANSRTQDIPVVVLSADAIPTQIERLLSAGAKDYLTKPLNVSAFLSLLDETLQHREK